MSYVKIFINSVWSTKNRFPFLKDGVKQKIISHIRANSINKNIFIDTINGYHEHVHCLFELNADMSVSKAINLIKGESSHWMNNNSIIKNKFEWADDYYATSVSESDLDRVRKYINNQEDHHRKITFKEEYDNFIKEYYMKLPG